MTSLVPSPRTIVPFVERGQQFTMTNRTTSMPHVLQHTTTIVDATDKLLLPWYPSAASWVEIYRNGERMFDYAVAGRMVFFERPLAGFFEFVCESDDAESSFALLIPVKNLQGRDASDTKVRSAKFCEPVIVLRSLNGHVRISGDRQSIAYTPNIGFKGNDTFAYALRTDDQLGKPECCYITVT